MAKGPEAVDFFDDEDDAPQRPPRRGGASASRARQGSGSGSGGIAPPASPQQARIRQIGLLIGAIVILILIVIAFRGCLNARKDRALENYVSDVSSITAETKQVSDSFFGLFGGQGAKVAQDTTLQNEINGDVGTLQDLLDRAQGLDAPGSLGGAQQQIALSYQLRQNALAGIAAQIGKTGGAKAKKATDAIYTQIRVLSASDILYARARDQIEQALADEDVVVDGGVPESKFLPDDPNYLIPMVTADAVSGAGIGGGTTSNAQCENDGLSHGVALVDGGTTLQPSGTALSGGGSVAAPGGDDSIQLSVQNQGEADESNVKVTVSGDGGVSGSGTIDSLAAGETQTVDVPIQAPSAGTSVEITADVATVPCEQIDTNNKATYSVTF